MKKCILFITIFLLGIISVSAGAQVWDDFSGSVLDTNKWTIEHSNAQEAASARFLDESLIDTGSKNYHNAQVQARDAATVLSVKRDFQVGESVELDIFYNSGSGNQEVKPVINGVPLDLRMGPDGYNCGGCATSGDIGYWNGVSQVGNQLGTWHLTVNFLSGGQAKVIFKRPDSTTFEYTTSQVTYPAKFGMEVLTGGNGLIHADYDNVLISGPTITPPSPAQNVSAEIEMLKKQIVDLTSQVNALTTRVGLQDQEIIKLKDNQTANQINALQQQITILIEQNTNHTKRLDQQEQTQLDINTTITDGKKYIQELSIQLTNLTHRAENLESRTDMHTRDLQDIRQTIRVLNDLFTQKQTWNEQEITAVKQQVNILEQKIDNTYTKVEVDNKITLVDQTIQGLDKRINKLETQVRDILNRLPKGWKWFWP